MVPQSRDNNNNVLPLGTAASAHGRRFAGQDAGTEQHHNLRGTANAPGRSRTVAQQADTVHVNDIAIDIAADTDGADCYFFTPSRWTLTKKGLYQRESLLIQPLSRLSSGKAWILFRRHLGAMAVRRRCG